MDLICPGCRTRAPGRIDLRTVERVAADLYACECGRRYPILDGIPVLLADPSALYAREATALVERDLSPEVAALLAAPGPDDAPLPRLLDHLSVYLDAHWCADAPVLARLAALPHAARTVELGCSVGRATYELAARADHVVGVDLQLAALRRARRLCAGEPLAFARRTIGRHYARAEIAARPARDNVAFACGDALDPPLVPGVFDRVVALNTLDSVSDPRQLLDVVHALTAPGGEVILASPFAWSADVLPDHHRFGGDAPEVALRAALALGYRIEDEADLDWTLRKDARTSVSYRIHYVRARKV